MSLYEFVQRASQEFEQKMLELGRNWETKPHRSTQTALKSRVSFVGFASRIFKTPSPRR